MAATHKAVDLSGNLKSDKFGYNQYYQNMMSEFVSLSRPEDYINEYERLRLSPFHAGGLTKGYVRWLSVNYLINAVGDSGKSYSDIMILDAGCGIGELSVYLSCLGFNVIGVDIAIEGCRAAEYLADEIGVPERCRFVAASLEETGLDDSSIDFVIGHASLRHFIKYESVPVEFKRIRKAAARVFLPIALVRTSCTVYSMTRKRWHDSATSH